MENFIKLNVSHLRLDDLGGLTSETVTVATPQVEALGDVGAAKLEVLTTTTNDFVALLNKERASLLTPQIAEKDQQRDALLSEIKRTAKAGAESSLSAIAAAGKQAMGFLTPIWHIDKEPMMSQTTQVKLLQTRYTADPTITAAMGTLGLGMQMQVLFNTNTTLNNLYIQRLAERGLVEGATASDLKRPTVLAYDEFCDSVAVTLSALPTPALQLLFNEMNDIRRKYSLRVPTPLDKDYTSVAPIPAEVHNGKHRTPLPRVFVTLDGELIELVFAVDFDVTYHNNVNVGTAHLYIHGKGKYTGTFVTTFQIVNAS